MLQMVQSKQGQGAIRPSPAPAPGSPGLICSKKHLQITLYERQTGKDGPLFPFSTLTLLEKAVGHGCFQGCTLNLLPVQHHLPGSGLLAQLFIAPCALI